MSAADHKNIEMKKTRKEIAEELAAQDYNAGLSEDPSRHPQLSEYDDGLFYMGAYSLIRSGGETVLTSIRKVLIAAGFEESRGGADYHHDDYGRLIDVDKASATMFVEKLIGLGEQHKAAEIREVLRLEDVLPGMCLFQPRA